MGNIDNSCDAGLDRKIGTGSESSFTSEGKVAVGTSGGPAGFAGRAPWWCVTGGVGGSRGLCPSSF